MYKDIGYEVCGGARVKRKIALSETIVDTLRDELVYDELGEVDVITESMISDRFGVSKTPAREALSVLCKEGFLEKIPHKGYFIKALSFKDVQYLLQYRFILESAAVELMIQQVSDAYIDTIISEIHEQMSRETVMSNREFEMENTNFHLSFAEASGNPYLLSSMTATLQQLRRALVMDAKRSSPESELPEHLLIMQKIRERDKAAANEAVHHHIYNVLTRFPPLRV